MTPPNDLTRTWLEQVIAECEASVERVLAQQDAEQELKNALHGFPDVNTYRDHYRGDE